jgi:environmental stress-induced protein Ves
MEVKPGKIGESCDNTSEVLPAKALDNSMIVLRETGYAAVPWKNGAGLTREILRVPADATAFDWRLSLATIDRAGPFSAFDGYERSLVLVRGAGIELDFGLHGLAKLSAPGQMASFDGGWQTTCALLDGPSTDLNLIVSKERAAARDRVTRVATTEVIQTSGWAETLVCCISGSVEIRNSAGNTEILAAVDIARCFPADAVVSCTPRAGSALLFIAALRHRG